MLKKKNYYSLKENIINSDGLAKKKIVSSKRKISSFVLISLLFLFAFSFVSAVKPEDTTIVNMGDNGLQIFYPQMNVVPQNTEFKLPLHISNISNGFPLHNTEAECNLHLYNPRGSHIYEGVLDEDSNGWDYELTLGEGNFSDLGQYSFYIWCNNSYLGGEAKGTFQVTFDGKELTESKSFLYITLLVLSLLIFAGLLFIGFKLPSKNKSNEMTGYIIAVSNLKYLKYFTLGLASLNLIWISYFVWMLSYAYLDFNFLSTIFKFFFYSTVALTLPLFIVLIVITIANFIKDQKIADFLTRGLPIK